MQNRRRRRRRGRPLDARFVILLVVLVAFSGYLVATEGGQRVAAQFGFEPIMSPISLSPLTAPDMGSAPQPEAAPIAESTAGGIPNGATEATIEYVHDGDTLFLTDGRKVRMLGIDTPEIGKNLECYGDDATNLLRLLLPEGTHVWVLPDIEPLDQYGRSLLFLYRDDATNINLEMLRQGAAEVEIYSPNLLFKAESEATERAAIDAGIGMWGSC